MPAAYSKNDHANGKERHEEILPLTSKAGWNVPKTKVDGNDIRQLRCPQKKPCEGNQANHQTGNINNQTEPFSIHGPTPSLNPTLRSAVSYSPLPLSAHCHANRRILVMIWLRLNDAGSASASTASWRGRGFGNSKARASCTRSAWSNTVSDIGYLPSFVISIQSSLYWREVMASASL